MEKSIAHRGPDEGHVWLGGSCGLAHRRLRVIDLSPAAAQPMTNEEGSLRVVFNGEIYNFQELRDELSLLGHRFVSRCDTEVLVHGFESWGTDLFARLRGMFAVALWDQNREQLVLARDRLGKKPLFFALIENGIAFGSELQVFKQVPRLTLSVSRHAFNQYMEFGYIPGTRTILNEVNAIPPGHFAVWNKSRFDSHAFWKLPDKPALDGQRPGDARTAAEFLEKPLRDAVESRLISDVPLGCFLSGGVDSSLVAALAQESLSHPLQTYTVGFADSKMDEARHAARIARHLATDHHELIIQDEEIIRDYVDILSRLPEPIGDDSFVPTYVVSRETKRHVTVALSGDGGDELFGGYDKYRHFTRARQWQGPFPRAWAPIAKLPWPDRVKKRLDAISLSSPYDLARWLSTLWKRDELETILAPGFRTGTDDDFFATAWKRKREFGAIEQFMLLDMETYLEGDILPKVDRASMAVGLEVRSPFLDQNLIECALQWPCRSDLKAGGKEILKSILEKYVPRSLFTRPKHGFGLPLEGWYRGALRGVLLEYTATKRIQQRGLLRAESLSAYVNAHLSGTRNFARKLHAVVAFEVWADNFFGMNMALADPPTHHEN